MILYVENPKDSIKKLLELIIELSKVAGYTINTQKSLAFLHTNNEKSEREIKESIALSTEAKRIKYLGINSPKAMVLPVVMYGCESWTIKKAERQRIDAFELWCWRRLLTVPWTTRRAN